jgi:acyl dehydratase
MWAKWNIFLADGRPGPDRRVRRSDRDRQFIHIDPAAAQTPFGGTVAHGFLSLSLLSRMGAETMLIPDGVKMGVITARPGAPLAPVKSRARVRGRFVRLRRGEGAGRLLLRHVVTVEIRARTSPRSQLNG